MSDGIRTRDRRDHNPELYQLSYAHQAHRSLAANVGRMDARAKALSRMMAICSRKGRRLSTLGAIERNTPASGGLYASLNATPS